MLPYPGTEPCRFENNMLSSYIFHNVFNQYNFKSFLRKDEFKRWETVFNLN
jgi:hypothetical protein